ncbi:MAG: DUF4231 domain-containing protein [Symploca sp. SIO2G7]|nr:DUF4231 domain-containing protein [Symploca sp. SIO2G7]
MSQDPSPATEPDRSLLTLAWHRQDMYSKNAVRCRSRFFLLRNVLLILGVVIVALSVTDTSLNQLQLTDSKNHNQLQQLLISALPILQPLLSNSLVILPITISALLAFAVKFDRGNNWLLLRGSAELLKSEIYFYRTYTREYQNKRNEILAKKIKIISERLKGSTVHQAALNPYEEETPKHYKLGWILKTIKALVTLINTSLQKIWNTLFGIESLTKKNTVRDDKFSDLNAEQYLTYRLEDQFFWYRTKAQQLDRQLQFLETSIYFFGGLGTFLAAVEQQSWIAVTVALTGALSNYLDFQRVEATLVGYNRAADGLYDVEAWWSSLSPEQTQHPKNYDHLVIRTEAIIRNEHVSWLQDMQDRLAEIYGSAENETDPTINNNQDKES